MIEMNFLQYPNVLVLVAIILWMVSVFIIYRNSEPKELNRTGLHFEIAAIAVLFLIYVNNSISGHLIGEEMLIVIPVVIGRFFVASEIIHFRRR